MKQILVILLYLGIAGILIALVAGLWNMTRSGDHQASRSNKLMRARIGAQAFVILILILLGLAYGAIKIGF